MRRKSFQFRDRLRSFRFAVSGVATLLKTQHNAWLHACAVVAVVSAGLYFDLSRAEWSWLVLAIMAVWTAEALNTAIEFLADVASPEFHPLVKQSKDVAAGAVLISAIGSVIIGVLVFGPHVMKLLE